MELASSALGGQKALVKTARWGSLMAWRTMVRELAPQSPEGDYLRPPSSLRAPEGASLQLTGGGHAVYVGNTCPWCHRVQLALTLRRIPDKAVANVRLLDEPERASRGGWAFDPARGVTDPVFDAADLREVYDRAAGRGGGYVGRCTAPLLVERSSAGQGCAVSNDSAQIVRMLGSARMIEDAIDQEEVELVPAALREEIDETNLWTYRLLSNAVYRAGFATTQAAFARAVRDAGEGLEKLERVLEERRFLCGDRVTEADVMLLPCAVRFDAVYATLFLRGSCGLWRERPALRRWLAELWSLPGVRETVDVQACQESYYSTLFPLNPSQIVPVPAQDPAASLGPVMPLDLEVARPLLHWRAASPKAAPSA